MADEEALNPADPVDARLLDMKAAFERRPDRLEVEQRIQRDQGLGRDDRNDAELARLKANFESGQAKEASSAPSPGYEQAKESFRESLGMAPGAEFEGHVQNIHSWVNETFGSVAEFDKLAAAAEEALGVRGAAELALKLAGAHARKRR